MVWYLEWVCKILNSTQYTWIELKCLFIWLRAFCSSHSLSWTELNWFSWVALLCSLPIFLVGCLRNLSKTYLKKSLLFLKSFVASYSLQHQVLFLSCIPNLANFAPSLYIQLSSVQLLSCVQLFATPWIAAHQASLSITNSQSLLKLMPIESLMLSNHLILCCPLPLLSSIFPSINKSVLRIRWPKYFSFSISPSNEYSGLISFSMDWLDLLAVQGLSRVFSTTTVQKHPFFGAQLSL